MNTSCFSEKAWHRLAAPRYAPEVVAVLEAAEELFAHAKKATPSDETDAVLYNIEGRSLGEALSIDVERWIAAGRPGLEPK